MLVLKLFFTAIIISYAGSIPPGTINLKVLQYCLEKKVYKAHIFCFVAATFEIIYVIGAIYTFQFLLKEHTTIVHLKTAATIILGIFASSYWGKVFRANDKTVLTARRTDDKKETTHYIVFKGVIYALSNPLAIIFWVSAIAVLQSQGVSLSSPVEKWYFGIGACLGTYLLYLSIILGYKLFNVKKISTTSINIGMGIMFTLLTLYTFLH